MRIILFDIDCLRPDHLGCYGYARPTSPNIDRIASGGVRFDNFYCASSPCLPSRTAWASGRFGIRNGVISNHTAGAQFHLQKSYYGGPKPENEMLMRQLRRAGHDPVSFSNFADRHSAFYFMCGWSEFHTPNLKGGGETAEEVNAPLMRWLESNASREDYLLHVNYWDAHRCYKMNASWADRFDDSPVPQAWPDEDTIRRLATDVTGPFTATGQFRDGKSPYPLMPDSVESRADFEHMITGYDASIAYVDHHVGQVLDELDRQGLLEDAAVIITSDHGDAFGEHGIYSDHVCADECIHRIPMIVRWPGVAEAGASSDALLYNVDLGPTLCELIGGETPEDWDGESFASRLGGGGGEDAGREYIVWDHGLYTCQRAVRTRQHLLVHTYDDNGYGGFEPVELYDMTADPYQANNLAADEPGVVAECDGLLETWLDEQRSKPNFVRDPLECIAEERAAAR